MSRSLDPLAFAVVRLKVYAQDVELETATAFILDAVRDGKHAHALVTNWHVLSGRKPNDPGVVRHARGGLPDNVRFTLHRPTEDPLDVRVEEVRADLFTENDEALWLEHRELGRRLDIGVLDLRDQLMAQGFKVEAVNTIADTNDMAIQLGAEAFVIGYPHGFSAFAHTPIWKRATIASEPYLADAETKNRVVIDATTREGMSGSPVVLRAATHYVSESGKVVEAPGAMRWIGVYSSRPTFPNRGEGPEKEVAAEIGYMVKSGAVKATLADHKPASRRNEVSD